MSDKPGLTVPQRMGSAVVGAIATSLLVTPFDVVKTRLQAQQSALRRPRDAMTSANAPGVDTREFASHGADGCTRRTLCTTSQLRVCSYCKHWFRSTGHAPQLRGTLHGLVTLARTEGGRTLWSGLQPTMAMAVPSTVIYFTAYDELRKQLGTVTDGSPLAPFAPMLAGSVARSATVTVVSPLELIRTQMQAQRTTFRHAAAALRAQTAAEGVGSLFRGLGATLFRDVPFSAIYWTGYEVAKSALAPAVADPDAPGAAFARAFVAGAASGMLSAAVTTPFDVVKTRLQAEVYAGAAGGSSAAPRAKCALRAPRPPQVTAMTRQILDIARTEGTAALFSGITARVAKVAPACAIMIGTYEYAKTVFAIAAE